MRRPSSLPVAILTVAALACSLAGCAGDDGAAVEVVAIGDPAASFETGPRLPFAAQLVRSATAEGLVAFDEAGRVIPALADRWIVTDDGLSYIFRLRDGTWPDGSDITGESARAALQQAMAGLRGTAMGQDLGVVSEVRAMAGRVIEIRLRQQTPDMLQLLAQPELGLLRKGRGAGPMRLSRKGDVATLSPIAPEARGLAPQEGWSDRVRKVRYRALGAAAAIERFNRGDADVVLGGRIADFPRLDASGVPRGAIRLDPVMGLFGLVVVSETGFLGETENREAVAMAVDRDALGNALNVGGWIATTRMVNPGVDDDTGTVAERWPGQAIDDRRARARARVAAWKGSSGKDLTLRIALPKGPGGDLLFARLSEDLGAIGITARRVGEAADADLRLVDTVARFARSSWFLNQLGCANLRGPCSAAADRLVSDALEEADPAKRADIYADAEARLTIANVYIPFGVPIRWSLVSGSADGFVPNRWALHPLMPLAMRPK